MTFELYYFFFFWIKIIFSRNHVGYTCTPHWVTMVNDYDLPNPWLWLAFIGVFHQIYNSMITNCQLYDFDLFTRWFWSVYSMILVCLLDDFDPWYRSASFRFLSVSFRFWSVSFKILICQPNGFDLPDPWFDIIQYRSVTCIDFWSKISGRIYYSVHPSAFSFDRKMLRCWDTWEKREW